MTGHIRDLLKNADKALEADLATELAADMEEFAKTARMPVTATLPEKSLLESNREMVERTLELLQKRYGRIDVVIGQLTDHLTEVQAMINAYTAALKELKPKAEPIKKAEFDKLVAQNADAAKKAS